MQVLRIFEMATDVQIDTSMVCFYFLHSFNSFNSFFIFFFVLFPFLSLSVFGRDGLGVGSGHVWLFVFLLSSVGEGVREWVSEIGE